MQFSLSTMPNATAAGPRFVARINPSPMFGANPAGSNGIVTPGSLDVSRWNALPLTDLTKSAFGFNKSMVSFSATAAYNFYQLNATHYSLLYGNNNANNIPGVFQFLAACDPASVQRYGFRPFIGTTRWMIDQNGEAATTPALNIQNTILQLTANYISWVHGGPLMAHGSVTIPLNPTIQLGSRFRYAPYKDGVPWDFYIEGYRHDYVFGGESRTTLTLTRGLPSAIYADGSDGGLLRAILIGAAQRMGGQYVKGLPIGSAPSLEFTTTFAQAAVLNQQLAKVFVTPQALTPPT
jgi:hypothetical protein